MTFVDERESIPEGYIDCKEIAERYDLSRVTAAKYCRDGVIKAEKFRSGSSSMWIVRESDLSDFTPPMVKKRKRKEGRWNYKGMDAALNLAKDPWESLAMAIVVTACKDYQRCLEGDNYYVGEFKSLQRFFRSQWFWTLTMGKIDPEVMMIKLEDEVYEFLDKKEERKKGKKHNKVS